MPSKHCCSKHVRLRFTVAVVSLVAVPHLASAQQQYSDAAPPAQRRVAAAPPQQRPQQRAAQQQFQQQQPQQRPAAGAPRQVQPAPQGTNPQGAMPVRRAAATAQQAGQQQAGQQPGRQYPVRQAAGSEPLPQQRTPRTAALPQQGVQPQPGAQPQQGAPRQVNPAQPAQGQPAQAQPGQVQPGQPQQVIVPLTPQEPFVLTGEQQRLLDQILLNWEKESDTVTRFSCSFRRWEFNKTYGAPENDYKISDALGDIKYQSPDHGAYIIKSLQEWDGGQKAMVPRGDESFDHWVCTGEAIFEFNHKQKQLIERQLAPEMRGKAITDGPLPFVFGTKAAQLKLRYWMRDVTPTDDVGKQIWLEAHPKQQRDAANFHHAFIILDQKTFLPSALRIVLPDGENTQDYQFYDVSKNSKLAVIMSVFDAPRTPFTWTKVVIPAGGDQPEQPPAQPAAQAPAQAQQPRPQTQR